MKFSSLGEELTSPFLWARESCCTGIICWLTEVYTISFSNEKIGVPTPTFPSSGKVPWVRHEMDRFIPQYINNLELFYSSSFYIGELHEGFLFLPSIS